MQAVPVECVTTQDMHCIAAYCYLKPVVGQTPCALHCHASFYRHNNLFHTAVLPPPPPAPDKHLVQGKGC